MRETALDRAVSRAEGDDAAADGGVLDALFNSELHLLLEAPPEGDSLRPAILELESGPAALAFDLAARLTEFCGDGASYAAMSGRALAGLLAGKELSLAVNPGVAPSELFYDPAALAWAAGFLAEESVAEAEARIAALGPPRGASPTLLAALDGKIAALGPALAEAWLAGAPGGLLLILRLRAGAAERPVARALAQTVRLAGPEGVALEITFADDGSPLLSRARAAGLGFEPPAPPSPVAPGTDPARPPRLR